MNSLSQISFISGFEIERVNSRRLRLKRRQNSRYAFWRKKELIHSWL